jgi:hypothetical protein
MGAVGQTTHTLETRPTKRCDGCHRANNKGDPRAALSLSRSTGLATSMLSRSSAAGLRVSSFAQTRRAAN